MTTKDWTAVRPMGEDRAVAYIHRPSGIRLCDVKRQPVHGYDPSGRWNVFVPGRVFPVNAGSGSAAEWRRWIEQNAERLLAEEVAR